MSAAVAVTPASGSITHIKTAVNVAVTGASANDATAYSTSIYPTEPQIKYYLKFALAGQNSLISNTFAPATGGTAEWNSVVLPAAGTWTLTLNLVSDDSAAATASVVVA